MPADLTTWLGYAALAGAALAVFTVLRNARRPVYPPCPNCKTSKEVVEVVYGEPDRRMLNLAKRRLLSLGGIRLHDDDPNLHCLGCDQRWLAP